MVHARGLVEFAVRTLIALLLLRTCLVEVCAVTTGSMAPTILGLHRHLTCSDCGFGFDCETATFTPGERAACPNCGGLADDPAAEPVVSGDRVLVDKTAFRLRSPRRWEPVVFRNPQSASTLFVKRVVGLPGESIQIIAGDIYVNGQVARKTLPQQRAMAIPVHDSGFGSGLGLPSRWQAEPNSPWTSHAGGFRCTRGVGLRPADTGSSEAYPTVRPPEFSWLVYCHGRRGPAGVTPECITDHCSYDQSTPRVDEDVSPVVDLLLSCEMRCWGEGLAALWATNGSDGFLLQINPQTGQIELSHNGRVVRRATMAGAVLADDIRLELSLIDRQVLFAINGAGVLEPYPFDFAEGESPPTSEPFAIGAQGSGVEVSRPRIYRDVYYTRPLGLRRTWGAKQPYRLLAGEYFVLGDNSPVSSDSRLWIAGPGVHRDLLVGKPFAAQGSRPLAGGRLQVPALNQIRWIP